MAQAIPFARTCTARRADTTTPSDLHRDVVPAPLETGRRPGRGLADDPPVGHTFEPLGHHDGDLETSEVHAEAEVLSPAECQQPLDGPVPDEFVWVSVFAFVAAGRCEERDHPLTRLDRRAVDGERRAYGAGEPLRGRAVADH